MYGLVNKAVRDLVVSQFGEETWQTIRTKAGVDNTFVGMSQYSDDVTYKLVGAASEVSGLTPAEVLEAFGRHWVLFTAAEGYGHILDMAGDTFVEFLQNMDDLHARIRLSMPDLSPPHLTCSDVCEESMRLHYHSHRDGLAPMVVGLLKGLGERFETQVEITHERSKALEAELDHDVFLIHFVDAS
jgi:hypothetical protein